MTKCCLIISVIKVGPLFSAHRAALQRLILNSHTLTSADSFVQALLNTDTLGSRDTLNRDVCPAEKRENGVLHANVSLDALDKRARSGATGARTKTPFGWGRYAQTYKLPAAGWINRASVCVCVGGGPPGAPHNTQSPKIKEPSVK